MSPQANWWRGDLKGKREQSGMERKTGLGLAPAATLTWKAGLRVSHRLQNKTFLLFLDQKHASEGILLLRSSGTWASPALTMAPAVPGKEAAWQGRQTGGS